MMMDITGYTYSDAELNPSHAYLLPAVMKCIQSGSTQAQRIFELGCGNGSTAVQLHSRGHTVIGIDASQEGIEIANQTYPHLRLYQRSAYDDLATEFGQFPIVLSLEVVEHVYYPRKFAATAYKLVQENGSLILSTPYHGYWKNLAIAATGKMDAHFTALWDHGHIKFWSMKTLRLLLEEAGFRQFAFLRVGRIPCLAKSMIVIARK